MTRRPWTRPELIAAFNLYCRLPFGKIHKGNRMVVELANLINRTPSAVGLKLSNFASFDPVLQQRGIKGMANAARADREIFEEFYTSQEELAFESEKVLAQYEQQTIEQKYHLELPDLKYVAGEERTSYVKTRVNQHFFREMVLSNYNSSCAITGISIPALLVASHIKPWAADQQQRLNPANGICLSALYDKAFDRGLLTIDTGYKVVLSQQVKEYSTKDFYSTHFGEVANQSILLPGKYLPNAEFLEWHRENIFEQ